MGGPALILALGVLLGQITSPQMAPSSSGPGGNSILLPPINQNPVTSPAPLAVPISGPSGAPDEDNWLVFLLGDCFPCLRSAGFKLDRPQPAPFVSYPYAGHYNGFLWTDGTATRTSQPIPEKLDWLSVRASVEDGNNFSNLNWVGVRVAVDSESRVGGTTNWNWYHDKFDCGCSFDAVLGDINLTYRLFQGDQFQIHVGAGCRILAEEDFARTGFNALASADFFPIQPLVVSVLVDGGTLGSVGVIHTRATVGATWRGLEIYGGYDFLRIGMTDLDGPVGGLKLWF